MAFSNRNLLSKSLVVNVTMDCTKELCIDVLRETGYCPPFCFPSCNFLSCPPYFPYPEPDFSPPPPPPLSPPSLSTSTNQSISPVLLILVSILGATFLLLSYYAIIVKCCSCWTTLRRPSQQPDDAHEDFIDENHGPFVDNPIWFITRIGIQDSIINSITVCKYKRGEGLIEGTECSVCLNEFQEDETLRLLPKCSHAFHPPCIDTWLRSHTNCPLCRAPIISNASGSSFTETVPNLNSLSPGNETQLENSQDDSGFGADQVGEVGLSVLGENEEFEIAKEGLVVPSLQANSWFRVLSDLAENHRVVVDEDIQPVRRSVSMDSSSASMIALSVATFLSEESEGCSDNQLVRVKKSNSGADLGNGNSTISKPMGTSSSIGRSIQREPISMKRSFSWGGKLLMSRNSRNRNSILPL